MISTLPSNVDSCAARWSTDPQSPSVTQGITRWPLLVALGMHPRPYPAFLIVAGVDFPQVGLLGSNLHFLIVVAPAGRKAGMVSACTAVWPLFGMGGLVQSQWLSYLLAACIFGGALFPESPWVTLRLSQQMRFRAPFVPSWGIWAS